MSVRDSLSARPIGERMFLVQGMADLTHSERTLLSVVAYFDGPGGSFPAIDTMAAHIGISVRRAKYMLKAIRNKGRLRWRRRRRATSIYEIAYDEPWPVAKKCTKAALQESDLEVQEKGTFEVQESGTLTGSEQDKSLLRGKPMPKNGQHQSTVIGFCNSCGHDRFSGQSFCTVCGDEGEPFLMAPHELESGIVELPFGLSASGLDTPAGRLLFLSPEGQAGLKDAYRQLLAETEGRAH